MLLGRLLFSPANWLGNHCVDAFTRLSTGLPLNSNRLQPILFLFLTERAADGINRREISDIREPERQPAVFAMEK